MKLVILLLLLLSLGSSLDSLTPAESITLKILHDIQVSPDMQSTLFLVGEATENSYTWNIYQTTTHENSPPKLLAPSLTQSFQPRWSPDGKWIAFLSIVDQVHQLYLMRVATGEIQLLFPTNQNIQTFGWSPDSRKIAFVKQNPTLQNSHKTASLLTYPNKSAVNGLWVMDIYDKDLAPRLYTSENYCVRGSADFGQNIEEFSWSPDSQKIVFAYSPSFSLDDFYLDSQLAFVDIKSGEITPIKPVSQYEATPIYSPDGKWIAYLGSEPPNYALNKRLHLLSSDGSERLTLPPTFNGGAEIQGRTLLGWTKDSSQIIFCEPKQTKYHLLFIPINGAPPKEWTTQQQMMERFTLNVSNQALGFVMQSSNSAEEVYITDLKEFNPIQMTKINEQIDKCRLQTEIIQWKSLDGLEIEGLLTYPKEHQKDKLYPLILMIHGGPMDVFKESFLGTPSFYSSQLLAENGFFVLRANPRGSSGYGKEFRCLNFADWGGKDVEDLMSGVDELIKNRGADPERLGVMGWSYGGYMTARIITQTQRFKAAIMGAGFSNLTSFAGTTDLPRFVSSYLGESWHNPKLYQQRSPIYSAHQVKTPCLIIHGLNDTRVPVSQSHEFYRALKKNQQTVKMILIPNMGHGYNNPKVLVEIMNENLNWFKRYLQETSSPQNPKKDPRENGLNKPHYPPIY